MRMKKGTLRLLWSSEHANYHSVIPFVRLQRDLQYKKYTNVSNWNE